MSDTSQGPGWWMASDGRWYPPQPSHIPPPPGAPGGPGMPGIGAPKQGNNGLAIASMVLGIIWICGLGSLLALILGLIALSQIRKSGGRGRGFAIAGVILGAIGVLVTAATVAFVYMARDNIEFNTPDERDDVSIVRCGVKETEAAPSMDVSITNDSSGRSQYVLIVEITGSGSRNFTAEISTFGPVASGETKVFTIDSSGDATSIDAPFECKINSVNRLAA